jgi:hypothetical protein
MGWADCGGDHVVAGAYSMISYLAVLWASSRLDNLCYEFFAIELGAYGFVFVSFSRPTTSTCNSFKHDARHQIEI